MFWKRKRRDRKPQRQYWSRNPSGLDAVAGYAPELDLVGDNKPAKVYPDEIDPAWADTEQPPEEPS